MKAQAIQILVSLLMKVLTPDLLKLFAKMVIDFIREQVLGSASKIDDMVVLPIIGVLEETFDIEK